MKKTYTVIDGDGQPLSSQDLKKTLHGITLFDQPDSSDIMAEIEAYVADDDGFIEGAVQSYVEAAFDRVLDAIADELGETATSAPAPQLPL